MSGARLRFGTSGWRGVLGEDFHFAGARALAAAIARFAGAPRERPRILVAHDTRFLGERLAEEAAAVLAGAGARPLRAAGPTATPVANFALAKHRAAAALVFTASHNPPAYQGLKLLLPWGGGAPDAVSARVNADAERQLRRGEPRAWRRPRARAALRRPPMWTRSCAGSGRCRAGDSPWCTTRCTAAAPACSTASSKRAARAWSCCAASPTRASGASHRTRPPRASCRLRAACAGSAGCASASRPTATPTVSRRWTPTAASSPRPSCSRCSWTISRAPAASRAASRSRSRPARSWSAVSRHYGLPCVRRPIGFKHLTEALASGAADVAGEESRGFAWAPFARDKDAILAGALLAEIVAETGAPLRARLRELAARHGAPACGRLSLPAGARAHAALARLAKTAPRRFDGARVESAERLDGFRLALEDGFVLWRASGTEPLLRVYAEAPNRSALARRLHAAAARVRAAR